ncbi:MAG: ChuX/HutX family heme-like substrate-binding protein [Nisaea sp.]|uniref:ChuX/HutX family heme-like substrate-binding protein n=1 Tax=Nisaea sp. TaxID=2024842 RepID=UPI00329A1B1B
MHAPEIAKRLNVSEAALVAARIGTGALRLRPDASALLSSISEWGRVLCAFSNESGVHMPLGDVALETNEGGPLRLFGAHMDAEIDAEAVAEAFLFLDRDESHGNSRSIQLFDERGAPIVKIFIFHKGHFEAVEAGIRSLSTEDQSRVPAPRSTTPAYDPGAASGRQDHDLDALDCVGQEAIEEYLSAVAGPLEIEAVSRHARVIWRGVLSGWRFANGMMHLHEGGLRSHLRMMPLASARETKKGGLAFNGSAPDDGGDAPRLLRIIVGRAV